MDATENFGVAGGVGGLLAVRESNGDKVYPLYDARNHVRGYLDTSGNVVAALEYNAFGEIIASGGSYLSKVRFGYGTLHRDTVTSLLYHHHRIYSPKLGRFINRDPIGENGGLNLYAYVQNDPVNGWDMLGNISFTHTRVNKSDDAYDRGLNKKGPAWSPGSVTVWAGSSNGDWAWINKGFSNTYRVSFDDGTSAVVTAPSEKAASRQAVAQLTLLWNTMDALASGTAQIISGMTNATLNSIASNWQNIPKGNVEIGPIENLGIDRPPSLGVSLAYGLSRTFFNGGSDASLEQIAAVIDSMSAVNRSASGYSRNNALLGAVASGFNKYEGSFALMSKINNTVATLASGGTVGLGIAVDGLSYTTEGAVNIYNIFQVGLANVNTFTASTALSAGTVMTQQGVRLVSNPGYNQSFQVGLTNTGQLVNQMVNSINMSAGSSPSFMVLQNSFQNILPTGTSPALDGPLSQNFISALIWAGDATRQKLNDDG